MLPLLLALLAPAATDCTAVGLSDLRELPRPTVIVLGESPGHFRDLRRAARLVRALRDHGESVTLALEVLPAVRADEIAEHQGPEPDLDHMRAMLQWERTIQAPFAPYRPLLALGLTRAGRPVTLLAVGQPPVLPNAPPVTPSRELTERLAQLAGDDLPYVAREPLARARATTDAHIAEEALHGWSGEGVLVVVADRTRVVGPGALPMQLADRSDAPVRAATLDWRDQDCIDDTWQWRDTAQRWHAAIFER